MLLKLINSSKSFDMIIFLPTYHGAGVRLWGTQRELMEFNDTVYLYWNALEEAADPIELQRDNILASFCYEIRHGLMGMRTVSKQHPQKSLSVILLMI